MSDKFIVTSICDINPDVLQKITFISNKHTDLEEFLENKNIDIVVVSTPPNTHYELAKKNYSKKEKFNIGKTGSFGLLSIRRIIRISRY